MIAVIEVLEVRGSSVDLRVEGSEITVNLMPGDRLILQGGGGFVLQHPKMKTREIVGENPVTGMVFYADDPPALLEAAQERGWLKEPE